MVRFGLFYSVIDKFSTVDEIFFYSIIFQYNQNFKDTSIAYNLQFSITMVLQN
jgi:hypothetical protein